MLQSHSGLSLQQRCSKLNRKFKQIKMTSSRLKRIYADAKIRYKKPTLVKTLAPHIVEKQRLAREESFPKLLRALDCGSEHVFWLDESIVSGRNLQKKIWVKKGDVYPCNDLARIQFPAQAICAATNRQGKVVSYSVEDKSFNADRFLSFLVKLRRCVKAKKFSIFLDNCSAHKTEKVKEYLRSFPTTKPSPKHHPQRNFTGPRSST